MEQAKRKRSPERNAQPKATPQPLDRNSYFIEELRARNGWPRQFTYALIARGILKSYKLGKRRRVSADAEREAIATLERMTAEGRAA